MRHLNAEKLMEYKDGQLTDDAKAMVDDHLSQCTSCAHTNQELQQFIAFIESDAAYEPPAEVLQWGVSLFQPILQAPESVGGKVRKIIASLVFDTFDEPALAGVRRVGAPPRQLLFRAGDVDVDVKIESVETNDRISLVGQVLSNSEKFFDNTPVKLESHGMVRYKTLTNSVGEFVFDEVPKDTYHLSVDLPEGQITLFCVHRGNS
ncbi:MAG TPA: zf-HC2 domain-containing protein [Terriglobia bacterium]|nr:zf-HC2 domain-containing protein [Terriglobia bacterium]